LMIGSFIACAILTVKYNLKGYWVGDLVNLFEGKQGDSESVYNILKYIYVKPWARIQPYIVGIYTGYIQFRLGKRMFRQKVGFYRSILLAIFAILLISVSILGIHSAQLDHTLSTTENVIYIAFSRTSYSIGLSILLLLCFNGRGGYIHRLLSHPIWIPFARVGLFAYLLHAIVLDYFFYTLRDPLYYSDGRYAFYFISCAGMTYAIAFIATIFVESPLRNLEKFYWKRQK
jgi:hypothetical protein